MEKTREPTAPQWCCIDCYVLLVNGDEPTELSDAELEAWRARYTAGIGTAEVTSGMLAEYHSCLDVLGNIADDCECETRTFSWEPCAICNSNLGGQRRAVTFWV